MAYELFEELSTCDLEEIAKEDIEKILKDLENEIYRRKNAEVYEAIENFKQAFAKLEELGVRVLYDCSDYDDLTCVSLHCDYYLNFDY